MFSKFSNNNNNNMENDSSNRKVEVYSIDSSLSDDDNNDNNEPVSLKRKLDVITIDSSDDDDDEDGDKYDDYDDISGIRKRVKRVYKENDKKFNLMPYRLSMRDNFIDMVRMSVGGTPLMTHQHQILKNPPCGFYEWLKRYQDNISLKIVGSGVTGSAYKLCMNQSCDPMYGIKMMLYNTLYSSLNVNDIRRPENVEYSMSTHISNILLPPYSKVVSPHFMLPILAFRCNVDNATTKNLITIAEDKIKSQEDKDKFIEKINQLKNTPSIENPNKEVLFYVSEFAGYSDLNSFMTRRMNNGAFDQITFKIILFQLIYTLASIQDADPSFRHNDMHTHNVLVQKINQSNGMFYHYQFKDEHFLIPSTDFSVRLWDMDFATSHQVPNAKVATEKKDILVYENTGNEDDQRNNTMLISGLETKFNFFYVGILSTPNLQFDMIKITKNMYDVVLRLLKESDPSGYENNMNTNYQDILQFLNSLWKIQFSVLPTTNEKVKQSPLNNFVDLVQTNFKKLFLRGYLSPAVQMIIGDPTDVSPINPNNSKDIRNVIGMKCRYHRTQDNIMEKINYRDYTPSFILKNDKLFDVFKVDVTRVQEEMNKRKIIDSYTCV